MVWAGNAQFVLIDQADDAGDRAIEGDNRSSNNTLLPRSNQLFQISPLLVARPVTQVWSSVPVPLGVS